jgi:hypothetical protein
MFDFQVSKEEFVEEFCREDEKNSCIYFSTVSLVQKTLLLYTLHVINNRILDFRNQFISTIHQLRATILTHVRNGL